MRALTLDTQVSYRDHYPDPEESTGQCLIRVHLAGICGTDLQIIKGYGGFSGVLGHEFVGTVVDGPREWRDRRVVGEINCVCGTCDMCKVGLRSHCRERTVVGIQGRDGCFADSLLLPAANLHAVPDNVSDEEAVFVEPLAAAYQVVKQCRVEQRDRVAVVGSGRLGLLVAQVLATTGCRLEVIGRNPQTLLFCDKKRIQSRSIDDLIPRNDRDVVVECTGAPAGVNVALGLVRPRGTVVLKSTCADDGALNLAAAVVNEVRLLGSRCGPFPEAIMALSRKQIDVSSMVARTLPLERGAEALAASADPNNIKVLLKINPR